MAATTGGVPRFNFSRSNTTIGHPGSTMGSAPMPKSATSAAGILDSSLGQAGSGAGGDGSGRLGYDPKLKRDKSTSSFKRHLAAARNSRNDETIRRKMALLKDQQRTLAGGRGRYTGGAKTPIQRDMEAEARNRVESELGRPVSSNDWPFVYFVVSVDQQPQQVVDGDGNGDGSARGMHTARQRQKFLVSRRRKVQEAREETERIREANIDMGLRLEPIKPQAQVSWLDRKKTATIAILTITSVGLADSMVKTATVGTVIVTGGCTDRLYGNNIHSTNINRKIKHQRQWQQ